MTKLDAIKPLHDEFIDRLVDGELTPAELRDAIDRLDREPNGWKRCSLAFLEAQCLRASFRAMGQSAPSQFEGGSLSVQPATPPRAVSRRRWLRGSIAAGLAAASFAMGWIGHGARSWSSAESILTARAGENAGRPAVDFQPEPLDRTDINRPQPIPLATWQPGASQSLPTVKDVITAVGRLRIGTDQIRADVPILAGPGINEQWLRNQPPPLNEHGQAALQRQGYQVDQRRRLFTTTLADGRRVTVPIDQVQIRYTGNQPL